MQLLDELSMVYTSCTMFYAIFSYGQSKNNTLLLFFVASLAAFITGYYHHLQNPVFHQNMFALLTTIAVLRSIYLMEVNLRPSRRPTERVLHHLRPDSHTNGGEIFVADEVEQARIDARDAETLSQMWKLVACALSTVLGGFLIWNLDNRFCPTLRSWRREIGLPWGILLEGHGWW